MNFFSPRFIAIILLFLCHWSYGQVYQPIQSYSVIPSEFIGTAKEQGDIAVDRRRSSGTFVSPEEEEFIRLTRFHYNYFLKSGNVTFNDSSSLYINRILDVLLKDDSVTRSQVRGYVFLDDEVNSFTLDNGMIIVTVGMLTHIKNEAQLAMVLAHEIIHYKLRHGFSQYMNVISNNQRIKTIEDYSNRILAFSQEQEFEADRLGYKLFQRSGYARKEGLGFLDLLLDGDLPYKQIPFELSFFEHGPFRFPQVFKEDSLDMDSAISDYDDKFSTHPNIERRREQMLTLVKGKESGAEFLVSEAWFRRVFFINRNVLCEVQLMKRHYIEAIYSAYLLLKEDSGQIYPKTVIGRSLFEIAAYSIDPYFVEVPTVYFYKTHENQPTEENSGANDNGKYTRLHPEYYRGDIQRLCYLFCYLSSDKKAILALDYNWSVFQVSGDKLFLGYSEKLITMLHLSHRLDESYFYKKKDLPVRIDKTHANKDNTSNDTVAINELVFEAIPVKERFIENNSAGDRIINPNEVEFCRWALTDAFEDTLFRDLFSSHKNDMVYPFVRKTWASAGKYGKDDSWSFDIDSITVIDPMFFYLNEFDRDYHYTVDFEKTDDGFKAMMKAMKMLSDSTGVYCNFLSADYIDSSDVEAFNTFCITQRWLSEKKKHVDNAMPENCAESKLNDSLMQRLGTRYLMTTTVVSYKLKRIRMPGFFTVSCIIFFPLLPAFITYAFIPMDYTHYRTVLYDLKTGETMMYYTVGKNKLANEARFLEYYRLVFKKINNKKDANKQN